MTLSMGVRPKGETGLPMLDLHHLPVLVPSLASVMLWMEGGFRPAAYGLTYVDYLQPG